MAVSVTPDEVNLLVRPTDGESGDLSSVAFEGY